MAINTDLAPGCYFYELVLGGLREPDLPLAQALLALKRLPGYLLWALLGLAILVPAGFSGPARGLSASIRWR